LQESASEDAACAFRVHDPATNKKNVPLFFSFNVIHAFAFKSPNKTIHGNPPRKFSCVSLALFIITPMK